MEDSSTVAGMFLGVAIFILLLGDALAARLEQDSKEDPNG